MKDKELQSILAFNYNNTESKMTFAQKEDLLTISDSEVVVLDTDQLTNVTQFISERRQGIQTVRFDKNLWRWGEPQGNRVLSEKRGRPSLRFL